MKIVTTLVAALILSTCLSGCSGGDDSKAQAEAARVKTYCGALKDAAPQIRDFNRADPDYSKMQSYFDVMHGLKKKAPTDLKEEWSILDYNIAAIEKAAKGAKLSFSSIPKLLKGKLPKGVESTKLPAVVTAFTGLTGGAFETANTRITDNAKKVCKVDMTSLGG